MRLSSSAGTHVNSIKEFANTVMYVKSKSDNIGAELYGIPSFTKGRRLKETARFPDMDSIPFSIAKSLETAFDSIINGKRQDNELTFTNIYHGTETTYTLSLDPRCRSRMSAAYSVSIRRCYDRYTMLEMRDETENGTFVQNVVDA